MKKQMLFVLSSLILLIAGCDDTVKQVNEVETEQNESNENARFVVAEAGSKKYVITDKESHVQYLKIYRNGGVDGGVAIQMLIDKNGNPYVSKQTLELDNRFSTEELDSKTFLIIDNTTDVQYLMVYRNGGYNGGIDITPLYDNKGLPLTENK